MTTTTATSLLDILVVLSRLGWRVDGPAAITAHVLRWHGHRTWVTVDGPANGHAASLAQLTQLLGQLDDGWTAAVTGTTAGDGRTIQLSHTDGTVVPVVARWHGPDLLPSLLAVGSGLLTPTVSEMLARRLYVLVSTPPESPAWHDAAIESAALLDWEPGGAQQAALDDVPCWVVASARSRLAAHLHQDVGPTLDVDEIRAVLLRFAATRP